MTTLVPAPATALAVTVCPRVIPTLERRTLVVAPGTTLEAIVAAALPDLPERRRAFVRVSVGPDIVPREAWARVRPKPGAAVMVRLAPAGGGGLRQILMIAVAVAAMAIGQMWLGPALASTFGGSATMWGSVASAATMMAGSLLVNALVPMRSKSERDKARYAISGMQNEISPDAPVPIVLGEMRMAPPFAALPYTEDVSDEEQFFYGLYIVGIGPHQISDLRIGDTPIDRYQGVTVEIRHGLPGEAPFSLITEQVYEEAMQTQLAYGTGEEGDGGLFGLSGGALPIRRVSGGDAASISVSFRFPGGLIEVTSKGKRRGVSVTIRIRARLAGTTEWQPVGDLVVTRMTQKDFRVSHRWTCPVRGRYEIEIARLTPDHDDSETTQSTCYIAAIRTFRPEYPLNLPPDAQPAGVAVRIKSTKQLQGMLDTFNLLTAPLIQDWDSASGTWTTRATRNPASIARYLQQGGHLAYPKPDAGLDLPTLIDWHDHCVAHGLHYDGVITEEVKLRDTLAEVCAAGRARPLPRGETWSVVIDRPIDVVTAVITPRNARAIGWEPVYVRYPDAVRVAFLDRSNDFKRAERVIPWIDFTGDPQVVEEWELPGLTDAAEVWRAARRRMRELMARPYPYTARQDIEHLALAPGDRVRLVHPYLADEAVAAAVRGSSGVRIWLDAPVVMSEGASYRLRVRDASTGALRVADVVTAPGETDVLTLTASLDPPPARGDLAIFGRYAQDSVDCVVSRVEPGDDWSATITMLPHAPHIDDETEADIPPLWDGRAGGVVTVMTAPAPPVVVAFASGYELSDPAAGTLVRVAPGKGATPVARYDIAHRLVGTTTWTVVTDVGSELALIYVSGSHIEARARAVSFAGIRSEWGAAVTHDVRPALAPGPSVTSVDVVKLPSGLRRWEWTLAEPPGADLASQVGVELRAREGIWETWDDLIPLHTGLIIASPWESAQPSAEGLWTIAARATDVDGNVGTPILSALELKPAVPQSIAGRRDGSDIVITVVMTVAQDSGFVRIYRSEATASVETEVDVSGVITSPPAATVTWTDVSAASESRPLYRYRARAESDAGVQSSPTGEVRP